MDNGKTEPNCRQPVPGAPPARGPAGHWLLGSLSEFRADMLRFFERCHQEHGPFARFRLGPRRLILVSDPSLIEEVLVKQNRHFRKHYVVRLLGPVLGEGLLLSEGAFWLRQRRLMQPAFSSRMTEAFVDIVAEEVERLAASWTAQPRRDVYRDMTDLTVHVASKAFLGLDLPAQQQALGEALETIHADFEQRFQSFLPLPIWVPTRANRRLQHAVRTLDAIIHRIIDVCRNRPSSQGNALAQLLQARGEDGQAMSDRQIRDEVMTLLLAGHDTTANALTWTWLLLSQHPQVFTRLREEAASVLSGRRPRAADLPHLGYTQAVVKEAMRLYPPVYAFGREAVQDCSVGAHPVRKGTSLLLCQWVVHRDPRFFDRPDEFLPQRWLKGLQQRIPAYAYFPFGGGPRVCIGKELALAEAVCVLAALAPHFRVRVEPNQDLRPWPTVTLRPRSGMRAVVEAGSGVAAPSATEPTSV
jgi:cytochrome P450